MMHTRHKFKAFFLFSLVLVLFWAGRGHAAEFPGVHTYPEWGWYMARVSSGDTLVISHESDDIERSVKLKGIVAPRRSFPGAVEARAELKRVLDGQELEVAFFETDRYGQHYVTLRTVDLQDVGRHLLAQNLVKAADGTP